MLFEVCEPSSERKPSAKQLYTSGTRSPPSQIAGHPEAENGAFRQKPVFQVYLVFSP